jgi:hypothetical protein
MSNTSTVTPYSEASSSSESAGVGGALAAACAVAAVAGVVTLARWLAEESAEDREAISRLKAAQGRELLTSRSSLTNANESVRDLSLKITSVDLQQRNPDSLILTAAKLGYRVESVRQSSASFSNDSPILLQRASGERLAIARNNSGKLAVHTLGDRRRVQDLVREHTVDRASAHLAATGMTVESVRLSNGEVQILARELSAGRRGGAAEIKAQVRVDGTAMVDVDKVKGSRCEEIVQDLAEAIGGEVSNMTKKDSYYQLPGEAVNSSIKI